MNKHLYDFFTKDHRRIEDLFNRATGNVRDIDMDIYHRFRIGLLTHIKMEEKILFPAAQLANGGTPIPLAAKLRLDHGALTALMVVPPDLGVVRATHYVMEQHDIAEEEPGGMYDICEALTHDQTQGLLERLHATCEVPVHPCNPSDFAMAAARRALARAGFDFDRLANPGHKQPERK